MEERAPSFDVVAVVAPAGGVDDVAAVLRNLPADFPAAVVVLQHLSDQGRGLASVLRRRVRLLVGWATEGDDLEPGRVILCPPASGLVVLPDGTICILPGLRAQDRPGDMLLESLAETHGERTLAVMLAGGGRDGAAGARAVKAAGGTVVAQGNGNAVPSAAIAAGAVDLVLPLDDIGKLLVDMAGNGANVLEVSDEAAAMDRVFVGDGEAAAFLRTVDWASNPLGPVSAWPASLAAAVRTMLDNPLPVVVHWGPDLVVLPNDAACRLVGADFPWVVGRPLRDAWPDEWSVNGPLHAEVLETGRARVVEDAPFTVTRGKDGEPGRRQEMFLTSAVTALRGDQGGLAGTMSTAVDTTSRVLGQRQLDLLRRLQTDVGGASTVAAACEQAVATLGDDPGVVPFALVYLLDGPRTRAQLTASIGLDAGGPAAPRTVVLGADDSLWPIDAVARDESPALLDDLADRLPGLAAGPYPEPPASALVLPLRLAHDDRAAGVVVLGVSARRPLDPGYRGFLDLVAAQVAAGMTDARARQHERGRLEALAELDRAKTEFFANVSHEFRTPLTLLLGPLTTALAHRPVLPPGVADDLEAAHRSALHLQRMVGALLDFSQIEAGRRRAAFEATDLSTLTRELAGVFRDAVEGAGLRLVVDCPPLPEPVWVDRVMWERIVSNLLSNALKFTLQGEITVTVRLLPSHAELAVADTGSGIPDDDIPHVFERFHRVEGMPARTREGTGIGLALVHDLVRLHRGRVRVRSRLGAGSTFTVWVPRGRRIDGVAPPEPDAGDESDDLAVARSHADEARAWGSPVPQADAGPTSVRVPGGRVLVVDDNADMRAYLLRLLGRHWTVTVAADGAEARTRLAADPPDVVVADVMMAEVDGLTLVRELRAHPRGRDIPVILVSARAGDDDVVAGLASGADDYIVKPFSSRELVARVGAQLELARVRDQRDKAVRTGDVRLGLALEATGMVAFEWDPTSNRVTFLGGDGRGLYGVTGDDIADLMDVIHDDDVAAFLAGLNRALTGDEPEVNEYRVRLPDGGERWIRSVAHRTGLPGEPRRLFGVSTDVTDRRTADDGLRQATEQLTADLEAMIRFQGLTGRLSGTWTLDDLVEEVLDSVIDLQRADSGAVRLTDPETGDVRAAIERGPWPGAEPVDADPDYRALQPDGAGTETTPLIDRDGRTIGALATHTRHPQPRSELELRLGDLYLRQAVALIAAHCNW